MAETLCTDADMLKRVEDFCTRHSIKPTTFGRMSIGDGSLVANLRSGRSLTLRMANRVVAFMAAYQPDARVAA